MKQISLEQHRLKLLSELCHQKSVDVFFNRPKDCSENGIEISPDGRVLYYPSKDLYRYIEDSERWEKAAKKLSDLATPAKEKFYSGVRSVVAALIWLGILLGISWGLTHVHDSSAESSSQYEGSP
jgi:hypothetical protein